MSATLGALVIAIATEFSVLLAARYEEERDPGVPVGEALRRAYSRTGMAVLASGITAIAGFAALIATDIRMLRDFGIVTVLDLGVALVGVLLVLPAALVWAEAGLRPRRGACAEARRPSRVDGGRARRRDRVPDPRRRRARAAGRQAVQPGEPLLALRRARLPDPDRGRDRQHAPHPRRRHPRHRARPSAATPLPEFARPGAARVAGRATRTSSRTTARPPTNPCPRGPAAHPGLRGRPAGGDPRLRPVRPAAGDLVLVHPRRRLPADPGRCRRGRAALSGHGQLPLDQRPRRPRRGAADRRASAAGGSRSAGTPTARSPTSTGSASARRSPSPTPAGSSSDAKIGGDALAEAAIATDIDRLIARVRAARGGRAGEHGGGRAEARGAAGSPRSWARSSPAWRCATAGRRARLGTLAPRGQGAPAGALRPLLRRRRRSTCATSRSPGPTGSSSATSASIPTSSGPRSRSWRWSG